MAREGGHSGTARTQSLRTYPRLEVGKEGGIGWHKEDNITRI